MEVPVQPQTIEVWNIEALKERCGGGQTKTTIKNLSREEVVRKGEKIPREVLLANSFVFFRNKIHSLK